MAGMQRDHSRKEKLSIYMVKEGLSDDGLLLKTANAEAPIRLDLGKGVAKLFIKKEVQRPAPPWTRLFTTLPEVPGHAFGTTNSVGAVLVYRLQRTFLLSFGHGFHLLRDEAIERDFGVRVTLNSVEPRKLRSLDKANYSENPLNSRTQSSRELDIFDLDLDAESELLYAVTGASKEPIFGSHITGRDALTIAVNVDVKGFADILTFALQKYTQPLPSEFQWFDNVLRVRDKDDIAILDLLLDDLLASPQDNSLWLGEPEIVDWESQIGYTYDLSTKEARPVLEINDLLQHLVDSEAAITAETLKAQFIHILDAEYRSSKCWPAYRCLYAEVRDGAGHYILRNGTWYKVKSAFVSALDSYLATLPLCNIVFPVYRHYREDEYNAAVALDDPTFHLMDKKNTSIGGPYDKIEFCDLIKDNHTLIHVKYYRSSATLSHLFAQANVAAETWVRDEGFRIRLNQKLPTKVRLSDPKKCPDASKYKIIYAIATAKALPSDLPFFSKVTLKNAAQTLQALRFNIELARIEVDPALTKTFLCKPKKTPKAKRLRKATPTTAPT